MRKNYFFGKYYKFIARDGFSFAVILSHANEGDKIQLITKDNSYDIKDTKSVIIDNNDMYFNIKRKVYPWQALLL